MTTPDERYFAIQKTRRFLLDLCHNIIPKKEIPKYASMCLRHFPSEPYMELLRERSQDILGTVPQITMCEEKSPVDEKSE